MLTLPSRAFLTGKEVTLSYINFEVKCQVVDALNVLYLAKE